MGTITNQNVLREQRVYDKDKLEKFEDDFYANTEGSLDSDIKNNYGSIEAAARETVKKRRARPDFKTRNKSFIKLYKLYRRMGIKNNTFHLALYDQDLVGIDPYSSILPLELKMKIFVEIMINPWYYLREICRIPVDGKPIEVGGGSEFLIDRNSAASWYCFINGIDHYDSKPRQRGKTQNAIAEVQYAFNFGTISGTFLFFNKDQSLAKQNLYRLKSQRDMLPQWLQFKYAYDETGRIDKGTDNITTMKNPITKNTIKVCPKATSKDNAVKLGRGETACLQYYDEFDFTPWNREILDAAAFAYSTASKSAKENNCLYGRILTSTPGYLSTKEGKLADGYISRMMIWKDSFLDEDIEGLKNRLNTKDFNRFMFIEHSWRELGLTIEWYEEQCKLVDYNEEKIMREILLKRIAGNEFSPFRKEDLLYLTRNVRQPFESLDYFGNFTYIRVYAKIEKKIPYVLSVDPAEGLSNNNSAFTLINPYTRKPIAEFKSPYINQRELGRLIIKFMEDRCPNSMIVIENNRGREVINEIRESRFKHRVWYDADKLNNTLKENLDAYGALKKNSMMNRSLGYNSTGKSKGRLYGIIEKLVREEKDLLYTDYLVKDIVGIEKGPTGRIILGKVKVVNDGMEKSEGDTDELPHGDNIISYVIGLDVLVQATNLKEFGIDSDGYKFEELSPEEKIQERKGFIQGILGDLPDNIRGIFSDFVKEKTPNTEQEEYLKAFEEAEYQQDTTKQNSINIDIEESAFYQQEADWDRIDDSIFKSYEKNNSYRDSDSDSYSSDTFNINDYID